LLRVTEKLRNRLGDANEAILLRIKALDTEKGKHWGKFVHVLDMKKEGQIGIHVDNTEAFGSTIAGISLLSESVLTLENKEDNSRIELFLPRRSLYILSGDVRYKYGHGILLTETFRNKKVQKDRRISILLRTVSTGGLHK